MMTRLAFFLILAGVVGTARVSQAACSNETLDVYRHLKSYRGWTQGVCSADAKSGIAGRTCIGVAISDQEQLEKILQVLPKTIEVGDCRIELFFWDPGWESGITIHN